MPKRRQIAALPVRQRTSRLEVMLITSRETGRWVIPKGWPWPKVPDHEAAAGEAWEEAGVRGRVSRKSIGAFSYEKHEAKKIRQVQVSVFVLEVREESGEWPEFGERRREWFAIRKAATLVDEPELKGLLLAYWSARRVGSVK